MNFNQTDIAKALERVSIEVNELWGPDSLAAAIETEDEVGCVLRMHIYFERFLNRILEIKVTGELKKIIGDQRDFKPKLALCAALGLPVRFGLVLHQINIMRNKLAHGRVHSIDSGDLQQLCRLVDDILTDGGKDSSSTLSKFGIRTHFNGATKFYQFGQADERIDFLLACGAFLQNFSTWMLVELAVARGIPREMIPKQ